MFVYEKAGLILTEEISRKITIPKVGIDLILQKAAFQSTHIFMHAVHIILSTIFTSLQTLYSNEKKNKNLYLCTHIAQTFVTDFIF